MDQQIEEVVELIKSKRHELREAQADFAERDRMAKSAKRRVESLLGDLTDLCDRLTPEPMPLFDGPQAAAAAATGGEGEAVDGGADESMTEDAAADDRWRALSLQALVDCGLPENVRDILEKADCFTLGALADLHARAGDLALGKIVPGIGPKKAEVIADAWERFWAGWGTLRLTLDPQPTPEPSDADGTPSEAPGAPGEPDAEPADEPDAAADDPDASE